MAFGAVPDYQCTNDECGWEGYKRQTNQYVGGGDLRTCPDCGAEAQPWSST